MRELPSGTVTFLFTDIEGSTKLLHELGAEVYSAALVDHRRLLRDAFARHGGVEVDTQGDAFFVAFGDAGGALAAAAEAQQSLVSGPIRVRMGLHTGTPHIGPEGYVGQDVHLGARIAAAGHGGQVLLSKQTRQLVGEALELTDHGEHRLKDFASPVWIFQLGTEHFPPLKTISNTNLPRPPSSFVGRDQEVADIGALLNDGARLVSLTGPGGSGKTRLAIEAAAGLVPDFRNGVFWVDLAPLRESGLVPETIAHTLGAKDGLAEHIGERQMLLVLDNLEQVVDAAPELAALLSACPNLRLLVTSRELLRVNGEVDYAVPPLATPEAVELFSARSGLQPTEAISELCGRLDNLPLAVELAAARTSVLSPAQILDRLAMRLDLLKGGRDTDPRQQTLRATIAWSYDLLDAEEQQLFARLSVFRGGCTLGSAEAICDADLDVLQSLVDKSLLRHADERFSMLETIREYALEQLEVSGEAEPVRRRHADYYIAFAEEAEPTVLGMHPVPWLNLLEAEHDNIRVALDRLGESGQAIDAMRLAGALWEFWCLRGHASEGRRRLEQLLAMDDRPTPARAKALVGASHLGQFSQTASEERMLQAEQALHLYRALDDEWGVAFADLQIASNMALDGNFAAALPLVGRSVERLRGLGDEHRAMQALRVAAWCTEEVHGRQAARPIYEQLLADARAAGDTQMLPRALNAIAEWASEDGRHDEALALLEEAYRIDREYGDPSEVIHDLIYFARGAALAGRAKLTAKLLGAATARQDELGLVVPDWVVKLRESAESRAREQIGDEAYKVAWRAGEKLSPEQAVELTLHEVGQDA